ncbi:hypothetical protein P5673_017055 [Acropora cervicornis]|uniref:Uncharacterized protein n=1 Tax=Acropora cervicornis TaxID=6130 RepID=A0AAD9QF05_ACRCE|nr:hypothetical protein P5673_017055 [Acropora cervicornis]
MVEIVESLTNYYEYRNEVLGRINGLVVRFGSPEQPPNMCEKESSLCVVWVGVCFGILVVNAMVPYPIKDGILCSRGIK